MPAGARYYRYGPVLGQHLKVRFDNIDHIIGFLFLHLKPLLHILLLLYMYVAKHMGELNLLAEHDFCHTSVFQPFSLDALRPRKIAFSGVSIFKLLFFFQKHIADLSHFFC